MSDRKFRWGISSPASIAVEFTRSIQSSPSAEIAAVASRDLGRAKAFAEEHGIGTAFGSLAELAASPDIDGVYVCSPVYAHAAAVEVIAAAGKAILIEKPFAIDATEAEAMFATAKRHDVFIMEAMWTRFLPAWKQIRALVDGGRIGEIRSASASFGFSLLGGSRDDFLLDPAKGGGSLLELGVYPVQLIQDYLGVPTRIEAAILESDKGVDLTVAAALTFGDKIASLQSSITQMLPGSASLSGTFGIIHVPAFFHAARRFEIHTLDGDAAHPFSVELVDAEPEIGPLAYQAIHVAERVAQGETESDVMTPDDTVVTLQIIDAIRVAGRSRRASGS
ncbi:Gfo/Idh/MocA family protein [Streptomyces sp. NPDC057137]|uniref:Gfo/Idh/MocA family protein n=1 Tax=Streptomyces sp. NPDC057137 TaxID=3346030 RepID=UPI0036423E0F